MSGTTHEQKVQIIREIWLDYGMGAINGMYSQLLAGGTEEVRKQFEAAARDAGFEQDASAEDYGHRLLTIFGLAWRKAK